MKTRKIAHYIINNFTKHRLHPTVLHNRFPKSTTLEVEKSQKKLVWLVRRLKPAKKWDSPSTPERDEFMATILIERKMINTKFEIDFT